MTTDRELGTPAEALLSDGEIFMVTRRCIDAWNRGDAAATAATYTDDVVYRDPKIVGLLEGGDALLRYLRKFFDVWSTDFVVTDERRIAGENAQLCMWDVVMTHRSSGRSTTISGMDLCVVRGGQLSRDEAFMDTLPLEALKA